MLRPISVPTLPLPGDGTDADEEAQPEFATSDYAVGSTLQVGEVQLLQCPVNEPLEKYLEALGAEVPDYMSQIQQEVTCFSSST